MVGGVTPTLTPLALVRARPLDRRGWSRVEVEDVEGGWLDSRLETRRGPSRFAISPLRPGLTFFSRLEYLFRGVYVCSKPVNPKQHQH